MAQESGLDGRPRGGEGKGGRERPQWQSALSQLRETVQSLLLAHSESGGDGQDQDQDQGKGPAASVLSLRAQTLLVELGCCFKDICRERDATSQASALTRRELHSELQALGSAKYILNHYDKRIATCLKRESKYTDLDLDLVTEEEKEKDQGKGKASRGSGRKKSSSSIAKTSSSSSLHLHQDGGWSSSVDKKALECLGQEYESYKERLVGEKRQRKELVQTFRSVSAKKDKQQEDLAAVLDFEGRLAKEVQQQKEGVIRIQTLFEKEAKYRQGITQSTFEQYLPLPLHVLLAQAAFEAKNNKEGGNFNFSSSLSVSIGGSSEDLHEYLSRRRQVRQNLSHDKGKEKGKGKGNAKKRKEAQAQAQAQATKKEGTANESELSLQEKEAISLVLLHPLSVNIKIDMEEREEGEGEGKDEEEVRMVDAEPQGNPPKHSNKERGKEKDAGAAVGTDKKGPAGTRQGKTFRLKFYYHPHLDAVFVQTSKDVVEALRLMHPDDPGQKLESCLILAAKKSSNKSLPEFDVAMDAGVGAGAGAGAGADSAKGEKSTKGKNANGSGNGSGNGNGLNKKDFPSYLPSQKVDTMRKFLWAQDLCGVKQQVLEAEAEAEAAAAAPEMESEEAILSHVQEVSSKRGFRHLLKGLLETTCKK